MKKKHYICSVLCHIVMKKEKYISTDIRTIELRDGAGFLTGSIVIDGSKVETEGHEVGKEIDFDDNDFQQTWE